MIQALRTGMHLDLPSHNKVIILAKHLIRDEWICIYYPNARARGEVIFTGAFLRARASLTG